MGDVTIGAGFDKGKTIDAKDRWEAEAEWCKGATGGQKGEKNYDTCMQANLCCSASIKTGTEVCKEYGLSGKGTD